MQDNFFKSKRKEAANKDQSNSSALNSDKSSRNIPILIITNRKLSCAPKQKS